jgi:iron complex outermembrane recepter protein
VTWKASLSQELAPKVMVYGSVATGYKGFAYDVSSGFNPARINASLGGTAPGLNGVGPVKAERSTSYELGLKSRFFDNKIQLNVTGFLTEYNNFQAQSAVTLGTPPALQLVLNNVGKLKTKGVEVEFSAKLVRQHTVTPLAVGEIFNTIWDCKDLIQNQLIDYTP